MGENGERQTSNGNSDSPQIVQQPIKAMSSVILHSHAQFEL